MIDGEAGKEQAMTPKQIWEDPEVRSLEVPNIDNGDLDGSPEVHLVVGALSLTGTIS
jgi:hypothetical protein